MPTVRLTAANVKTLPAIGGRVDYRDDVLRGLVLRVSPTGSRTFVLAYSRRGKNKRYTLGPTPPLTLAVAREEGRKILVKIMLGEDPQEWRAAARNQLSVIQLAEAALADLTLTPKTRYQWGWTVRTQIASTPLGARPAAELTRGQIKEWGRAIAKRSPSVADAAFRVLRRVFSWGVEMERLTVSPFVRQLRNPGGKRKEFVRVLTPEEIRALVQALEESPGSYADAVLLLLYTVGRRDDIRCARLVELQGLDGMDPRLVVSADRYKSKREQIMPLAPQAVAAVRRQLERAGSLGSSGLLFPSLKKPAKPMGWPSDWVGTIKARMEELLGRPVPRWTIHSLRHTGATQMGEHLSVSYDLIRLLLGHAAPSGATRVYSHAERIGERRASLLAWAALIDRWRVTEGPARVLPHSPRGAKP